MKSITVEAIVHADVEKIWDMWTGASHIEHWNHASDDWECPHAENDVRVGGKFVSTMRAVDKSEGFDFNGVYTEVTPNKSIAYTIEGGRIVTVSFEEVDGGVHVTETFEMENENTEELQRNGWQSILNNFKQYVESH